MKYNKDTSTAFISIFNCEDYYVSSMQSHADRKIVYFKHDDKYYKLANLYIRNKSYKLEMKSLFSDYETSRVINAYSYKRLNKEQVLDLLKRQKIVILDVLASQSNEQASTESSEVENA